MRLLNRKSGTGLIAAAAAVGILAATPVHAQEQQFQTPTIINPPVATGTPFLGNGRNIALGGEVVLRIRSDAGGMTAEQRADEIRNRLIPVLSMPDIDPKHVNVRKMPGTDSAVIYVKDQVLITVTNEAARLNNTRSAYQLAQVWADNLREVLPEVHALYPRSNIERPTL